MGIMGTRATKETVTAQSHAHAHRDVEMRKVVAKMHTCDGHPFPGGWSWSKAVRKEIPRQRPPSDSS